MRFPASVNRFGLADALVHDSLPIGGIAVALMLGTYGLFQLPVSVPLLVAGFCGAALVYGVDRALVSSPEDQVNHPDRAQWVQAHRTGLLVEMGLLILLGVWAGSQLRGETVLGAGGIAALTGLHLVPLGRWGRPLKAMGLGKPIVVAGGWTLGGTLLPLIEAGRGMDLAAGALVGARMLFILPNVMVADWADRRGDAAAGLQPWAREERGQVVRGAATILLLAVGGGTVIVSTMVQFPSLLLVDALGPLLMIGAVWGFQPGRPHHRLLLDAIVGWPLVTAITASILHSWA